MAVRRVDGRGLPGQVEVGDLPFHAADADGAEHVIKGDPDGSQVRLVVPHTDAVEGVAVDQGHLDRVRAPAQFVELAGRADRAPQPGEPASQNQDLLGAHSVSSLTGRTGMSVRRLTGSRIPGRRRFPYPARLRTLSWRPFRHAPRRVAAATLPPHQPAGKGLAAAGSARLPRLLVVASRTCTGRCWTTAARPAKIFSDARPAPT